MDPIVSKLLDGGVILAALAAFWKGIAFMTELRLALQEVRATSVMMRDAATKLAEHSVRIKTLENTYDSIRPWIVGRNSHYDGE